MARINSKKKGNFWENRFADFLNDNGFKAWRDNASGGGSREKTDVGNGLDYSFQVKGVKKLNLKEAWRQAEKDALQVHDTPAVVIHFDGFAQNQFLITIDGWTFMELLKAKCPAPQIHE